MICEAFEVVTVPFPFTDRSQTKKRPALVLSAVSTFNKESGHCLMAMITSAKNPSWPLDIGVSDLEEAGLPAPSIVRMKLFTLDNRFILAKLGSLAPKDRKEVSQSVKTLLGRVLHR